MKKTSAFKRVMRRLDIAINSDRGKIVNGYWYGNKPITMWRSYAKTYGVYQTKNHTSLRSRLRNL